MIVVAITSNRIGEIATNHIFEFADSEIQWQWAAAGNVDRTQPQAVENGSGSSCRGYGAAQVDRVTDSVAADDGFDSHQGVHARGFGYGAEGAKGDRTAKEAVISCI